MSRQPFVHDVPGASSIHPFLVPRRARSPKLGVLGVVENHVSGDRLFLCIQTLKTAFLMTVCSSFAIYLYFKGERGSSPSGRGYQDVMQSVGCQTLAPPPSAVHWQMAWEMTAERLFCFSKTRESSKNHISSPGSPQTYTATVALGHFFWPRRGQVDAPASLLEKSELQSRAVGNGCSPQDHCTSSLFSHGWEVGALLERRSWAVPVLGKLFCLFAGDN